MKHLIRKVSAWAAAALAAVCLGLAAGGCAAPAADPILHPGPLPQAMQGAQESIVVIGQRWQFVYHQPQQDLRLVVEVQLADTDEIPMQQLQAVQVGRHEGRLYLRGEGEAVCPGLPEGARRPAEGEWVVEWQQGKWYLRLFGDLAPEELLAMAAGTEVST